MFYYSLFQVYMKAYVDDSIFHWRVEAAAACWMKMYSISELFYVYYSVLKLVRDSKWIINNSAIHLHRLRRGSWRFPSFLSQFYLIDADDDRKVPQKKEREKLPKWNFIRTNNREFT